MPTSADIYGKNQATVTKMFGTLSEGQRIGAQNAYNQYLASGDDMLTAAKKAVSIYGSGGSVPDQSFSQQNTTPKQEKMPTPNYDLTGFTSAQKKSLSDVFSSGGQSASDKLYGTMSAYNKTANRANDKSNIIKPVAPTQEQLQTVQKIGDNQSVARTSTGQVGNPTGYFTGPVGAEGAYNPYTGGQETENGGVGVNQGKYSPENKQKMWEAAGNTGAFNQDAFDRAGPQGALHLKDAWNKAAQNVTAQKTGIEEAQKEGENLKAISTTGTGASAAGATVDTTKTTPTTQSGGLSGYIGGVTEAQKQYFKDSGIQDQLDSLNAEKKRLEAQISGGTLSDESKKYIVDQYNAINKQLETTANLNLSQNERNRLNELASYDVAIAQQQTVNQAMNDSAARLAALTGASYSSSGITGLSNVLLTGQLELNKLATQRANVVGKYADQHDAIISNYTSKVQENNALMNQAIEKKYNDTMANITKIQNDIGTTTKDGAKAVQDLVKDYTTYMNQQFEQNMKKQKFEFDQAKFSIEQNYKEQKDARDNQFKTFDTLMKSGNMYGIPTEQIDSLDVDDSMKTLLKGAVVRDTVSSLNEYGKSMNIGDIGTRYADAIRKGIANGYSSEEIAAAITKDLNIPALKKEAAAYGANDYSFQNLGNGKLARTDKEGNYQIIDTNGINQAISSEGMLKNLGTGKVTGYGGEYDGYKGLDVDGKKGDPIVGFAGKVVSTISADSGSPFGNSVLIQDADGNQIRLSHLDSLNVKAGDEIGKDSLVGTIGNTGNVVAMNGGDGSHLDIRIKAAGSKSEMTSHQAEKFLQNYGTDDLTTLGSFLKATQPRGQGYSDDDVKAFNQNVDRFTESGDRKGMMDFYRAQLINNKKGISEAVTQAANISQNIGDVRNLMKEYEADGGDMNIFSGNFQKLQEKLGSSGDPRLVQIAQKLGMLTSDYIKAQSGTAASDAEVQRLVNLLPNTSSTFDRNMILADGFENRVLNQAKNELTTLLGSRKEIAPELFPELYGREKTQNVQNASVGASIGVSNMATPEEIDQYFNQSNEIDPFGIL